MRLAYICGDNVNGLPVHVWPEGARVGDPCLCECWRLDLLGATYSAGLLERTAD